MASSGKGHHDGVEITAIGVLYCGPLEKKYWSSSRGKEKYPYPLGYQATRWHGGHSYFMEVSEGPRGPLFGVTCEEGIACSGQTPSAPWEDILKKRHAGAKKIGMRSSSASIDGPEMFGFTSPLVQRLCRDLVVSASGIAEQSGVEVDCKVKDGNADLAGAVYGNLVVHAESGGKSPAKARKMKKLTRSISEKEVDQGFDKDESNIKQLQAGKFGKQLGVHGKRRHDVQDSGNQKSKRLSRANEEKLQDVEITFIKSLGQMNPDLSVKAGDYSKFVTAEDEKMTQRSMRTKRPRSSRLKGRIPQDQDTELGMGTQTIKIVPDYASENILAKNPLLTRKKRLKGQEKCVEVATKVLCPINSEQSTATNIDIVEDSVSPGPEKQEVVSSGLPKDRGRRAGSQNGSSPSQITDTLDSATVGELLPKNASGKKKRLKLAKPETRPDSVKYKKYGTNVDLTQSEGVLSIDLMCPSVDDIRSSEAKCGGEQVNSTPKDSGSSATQDGDFLLLDACKLASDKDVVSPIGSSTDRDEVDVKRKQISSDMGSVLDTTFPNEMPHAESKSQCVFKEDVEVSHPFHVTQNRLHGCSYPGEEQKVEEGTGGIEGKCDSVSTEASRLQENTFQVEVPMTPLPAECIEGLMLSPDGASINQGTEFASQVNCANVSNTDDSLKQGTEGMTVGKDGSKQLIEGIEMQCRDESVRTTTCLESPVTSNSTKLGVCDGSAAQLAEMATEGNGCLCGPSSNEHSLTTSVVREDLTTVSVVLENDPDKLDFDMASNSGLHLRDSIAVPNGLDGCTDELGVSGKDIGLTPFIPDRKVQSALKILNVVMLAPGLQSSHQEDQQNEVVMTTSEVPARSESFASHEGYEGVLSPYVRVTHDCPLGIVTLSQALVPAVLPACVEATCPGDSCRDVTAENVLERTTVAKLPALPLFSPLGGEGVGEVSPSTEETVKPTGVEDGHSLPVVLLSGVEVINEVECGVTMLTKIASEKIDAGEIPSLPVVLSCAEVTSVENPGTDVTVGSDFTTSVAGGQPWPVVVPSAVEMIGGIEQVMMESVPERTSVTEVPVLAGILPSSVAVDDFGTKFGHETLPKSSSGWGVPPLPVARSSEVAVTSLVDPGKKNTTENVLERTAVIEAPSLPLVLPSVVEAIDARDPGTKLRPDIVGKVISGAGTPSSLVVPLSGDEIQSAVVLGRATAKLGSERTGLTEVPSFPDMLPPGVEAISVAYPGTRVIAETVPEMTEGADVPYLPVSLSPGVDLRSGMGPGVQVTDRSVSEKSSAEEVSTGVQVRRVLDSGTSSTAEANLEMARVVAKENDPDIDVSFGRILEHGVVTVSAPSYEVDLFADTLPAESDMNATAKHDCEKIRMVDSKYVINNLRGNKPNTMAGTIVEHDGVTNSSPSQIKNSLADSCVGVVLNGSSEPGAALAGNEKTSHESSELGGVVPGAGIVEVHCNPIVSSGPAIQPLNEQVVFATVKETEPDAEVSFGNIDEYGVVTVLPTSHQVDLLTDTVPEGEPMTQTWHDDPNEVLIYADIKEVVRGEDMSDVVHGDQDATFIITNEPVRAGLSVDHQNLHPPLVHQVDMTETTSSETKQILEKEVHDHLAERLQCTEAAKQLLPVDRVSSTREWQPSSDNSKQNGESPETDHLGYHKVTDSVPSDEPMMKTFWQNDCNEGVNYPIIHISQGKQDVTLMSTNDLFEEIVGAKLSIDSLSLPSPLSQMLERGSTVAKAEDALERGRHSNSAKQFQSLVPAKEPVIKGLVPATEDWQMPFDNGSHHEDYQKNFVFEHQVDIDDSSTMGLEEYANILKAGLDNLSSFEHELGLHERDEIKHVAFPSSQDEKAFSETIGDLPSQGQLTVVSQERSQKDDSDSMGREITKSMITLLLPHAAPLLSQRVRGEKRCASGKSNNMEAKSLLSERDTAEDVHFNDKKLSMSSDGLSKALDLEVDKDKNVNGPPPKTVYCYDTDDHINLEMLSALNTHSLNLVACETTSAHVVVEPGLEVNDSVPDPKISKEIREVCLTQRTRVMIEDQRVVVAPGFENTQVYTSRVNGQSTEKGHAEQDHSLGGIDDLAFRNVGQPQHTNGAAALVTQHRSAEGNAEVCYSQKEEGIQGGKPSEAEEDVVVCQGVHNGGVQVASGVGLVSNLEENLFTTTIESNENARNGWSAKLDKGGGGCSWGKVNGSGSVEESASSPAIPSLSQEQGNSVSVVATHHIFDHEGLPSVMKNLRDPKLESAFCIDHSIPVLAIVLNVRGDEVRLCVVCGDAKEKGRTLYVYGVLYGGNDEIEPQLLSAVTCTWENSGYGTLNVEIPMDEAAVRFTPDGQHLVLLDCYKLSQSCSLDVNNHNGRGVNIVSFEMGAFLVSQHLKSDDLMRCLTVPGPQLLIGAGDEGCINCWELDSGWRTCRDRFSLPRATCNGAPFTSVTRLFVMSGLPHIVVGCDYGGSFALWDTRSRMLLSSWHLPNHTVLKASLVDITTINLEQSEDLKTNQYNGHPQAIARGGSLSGLPPPCLLTMVSSNRDSTLNDNEKGVTESEGDIRGGQDSGLTCKMVVLKQDGILLGPGLPERASAVTSLGLHGVLGTAAGLVHIWDVGNGMKLCELNELEGSSIVTLATNPSSVVLAAANERGQVIVYGQKDDLAYFARR